MPQDRLYNDTPIPLNTDEFEACPYCGVEVSHLCPDGLSFCDECEKIVEGSTVIGTYED